MSDIFTEFMKNYNKLAEINGKPLMEVDKAEERVDWYESGDELDEDIEEEQLADENEMYMPEGPKNIETTPIRSATNHLT